VNYYLLKTNMPASLKNLDMIGPNPKLYIEGSTIFKTRMGGILTILVGHLSILCIIGFGIDIIRRKEPNVYDSERLNFTSVIKRDQMAYLFAPMLPGGTPIDDYNRKFQFQIYVPDTDTSRTGNETTLWEIYNLVRCNETEFFRNNLYDLKTNLIGIAESYYCLPDDFNRDLIGQFGGSKFVAYDFLLSVCTNSTERNDCIPSSEFIPDIDNLWVQFVYLNYYTDLTDYNEPFKPIWSSDLLQCSSRVNRVDDYMFKTIDLITDSGFIISDPSNNYAFTKDSKSTLTLGFSPEISITAILELKVTISNLKIIYTRSYIKLQDIFANVGGFLKVILMVFNFILSTYARRDYIDMVLNEIIVKYNKYEKIRTINTSIDTIMIHHDTRLHAPKVITYRSLGKRLSPADLKDIKRGQSWKNMLYFCFKKDMKNRFLKRLEDQLTKSMNILRIFKYVDRLKTIERIIFSKEGKVCQDALYHLMQIDRLCDIDMVKEKKQIGVDSLKLYLERIQENKSLDLWKNMMGEFNKI
jgi:hypothetical protein